MILPLENANHGCKLGESLADYADYEQLAAFNFVGQLVSIYDSAVAQHGQRSIKADHYGHPTAKINTEGTPPLCSLFSLRHNYDLCR